MRLGKKERKLRKEQWNLYRSIRSELIADNKAHLKELPTSKGYRMTPDLRMGYVFHDPSNLPRQQIIGSDSWTARRNAKK